MSEFKIFATFVLKQFLFKKCRTFLNKVVECVKTNILIQTRTLYLN